MKNLPLILAITLSTLSRAQVTANWLIGGNTTTGSVPYFGTNNNNPVVVKTNGTEVLRFKTNGELKVFTFDDNITGGVIVTTKNGILQKLPFGTGTKVLFDNGMWGNLPSSSGFWAAGTGSKIYYTAGKVGIGTSTPNFDLDVQGSARITNTLVVNGQLIISEKIQTSRQLKSMRVESDSIMMDSTRALYGNTMVKGNLRTTYNLRVDGNITSNGIILAQQGFMFDNANGIKFIPATTTTFATFKIGSPTAFINLIGMPLATGGTVIGFGVGKDPGVYSKCLPALTTGNLFANRLIIAGATNALDIYNNGYDASINLGTDLGYAVPVWTPIRKIQLANLCESDVEICKQPTLVGYVSTGPRVEIGTPIRNNAVTLNIKQITGQTEAIKITNEANITNFLVKSNGYVYAREINVMPTNIAFPDYVFASNYKLMPLKDVEDYVIKNKHLPNIPSAKEVEKEGINLSELQIKQMEKIEDIYLYIIELKKENDELKKRIDLLEQN